MHISKQMYVLFKENNDNPGPVLFRWKSEEINVRACHSMLACKHVIKYAGIHICLHACMYIVCANLRGWGGCVRFKGKHMYGSAFVRTRVRDWTNLVGMETWFSCKSELVSTATGKSSRPESFPCLLHPQTAQHQTSKELIRIGPSLWILLIVASICPSLFLSGLCGPAATCPFFCVSLCVHSFCQPIPRYFLQSDFCMNWCVQAFLKYWMALLWPGQQTSLALQCQRSETPRGFQWFLSLCITHLLNSWKLVSIRNTHWGLTYLLYLLIISYISIRDPCQRGRFLGMFSDLWKGGLSLAKPSAPTGLVFHSDFVKAMLAALLC